MAATSFMSEHTVELAVSRRFEQVLRCEYRDVASVYFWLSREGGNLANAIHGADEFRAVALFPRRPKLRRPDDHEILLTVNDSLIAAANCLVQFDIPAVAACPLARSFWEMDDGLACLFVAVDESTASAYRTDLSSGATQPSDGLLLGEMDVLSFVRDRTEPLTIEALTAAVRAIRNLPTATRWFGAGFLPAAYRPTMVLCR